MNPFLKSSSQIRFVFAAALTLAVFFLLLSCRQVRAASPVSGTWYEQAENGDVLTVSDQKVHLKIGWSDYESEEAYTLVGAESLEKGEAWSPERKEGNLALKQEGFGVFGEIYYLPEEDTLVCYDWPHTDGDGGHHRHVFLRTPYEAPPEPTYGVRTDSSDPDAPKTLPADWPQQFRKLEMSFYDEGVVQYPDMAMQYPAAGTYQYSLTMQDGTAVLTSDFCPNPVALSGEALQQVLAAVTEHDLPSLNGLDIRTADVPEELSGYSFAMEYGDGGYLRSAANYKDVPENWAAFQEEVHALLFRLTEEAGYSPYTGEFHSTLPMKRFGAGDDPAYTVGVRQEAIEKPWHEEGVTFKCWYDLLVPETGCPAPLKAALEQFSQETTRRAEQAEQDFGQEYNFVAFDVQPSAADSLFFTFRVVETYMRPDYTNDLVIHQYCFDAKTGSRLYISDLIPDTEELQKRFTEAFVKSHGWVADTIRGDQAQTAFRNLITDPSVQGPMEFSVSDGALLLYPPAGVLEGQGWVDSVKLWYEDIQDLMNETYVTVRGIETK